LQPQDEEYEQFA